MRILVDTNVLLRLVHAGHPQQAEAEQAVSGLIGQKLFSLSQVFGSESVERKNSPSPNQRRYPASVVRVRLPACSSMVVLGSLPILMLRLVIALVA